MRYVSLLLSAAVATLLSGCAVYPVGPVAGPPPGVVYGAPVPVGVASAPAPYPYGYPYPYDYAYGYGGPAYYGPPVFFTGSFGFVHRVGPGFRPGFRGARPSGGNGGLHLLPRGLRR